MGTWGIAIFSDDMASDIRDSYNSILKCTDDDDTANKMFWDEYKAGINSDEAAVIWYALASCQWQKGRLTHEVKEKALYYIDNEFADENLALFKEQGEKLYNKRKKVLQELRVKLCSPQPERKKIPKYKTKTFGFNVGDIVAFKFRSDEEVYKNAPMWISQESYEMLKCNYVAIIVLDIFKSTYKKYTDAFYETTSFAFLNYLDENIPSLGDIPNEILACNLESYNMVGKKSPEGLPVGELIRIFGEERAFEYVEDVRNKKIKLEFCVSADTEYVKWLPNNRTVIGNDISLCEKIKKKIEYSKNCRNSTSGQIENIFNYLLRKKRQDLFINSPLDTPCVRHIKLDLSQVTCWSELHTYCGMDDWVEAEAVKTLVTLSDDEIIMKVE